MKFEDMANWTEEQIKKEVVRLSEECEKKQHIILDYEVLSETINQKLLENDNWKLPTDEVENVNTGHLSNGMNNATRMTALQSISFRPHWTYLLTGMQI